MLNFRRLKRNLEFSGCAKVQLQLTAVLKVLFVRRLWIHRSLMPCGILVPAVAAAKPPTYPFYYISVDAVHRRLASASPAEGMRKRGRKNLITPTTTTRTVPEGSSSPTEHQTFASAG